MNLLEKNFRSDMVQISTKDVDHVQHVFKEHGISFSVDRVPVSSLEPMQHGVKKEKVDSMAEQVEKDGVDSLPMMLVSKESKILDGHHRKFAIAKAEGDDAVVEVLRLNYGAEESLEILKKLQDQLSEAYSQLIEMMCLCSLYGTFTENRLMNKGFSQSVIRQAVRGGVLLPDRLGNLTTASPHLREGKLKEFAPFVAGAARVAAGALAKSVSGKSAKQVGDVMSRVKDGMQSKVVALGPEKHGKVKVVDTEHPEKGPEEVDAELLAAEEEEKKNG